MNRLKELRSQEGLTLKAFSQKLNKIYDMNISDGQLSNYENEKRTPRDQETWDNIADYFDVPVAYLMGLDSEDIDKEIDAKKMGKLVQFTRYLWEESYDSFANSINSTLKFYSNNNENINADMIKQIEEGKALPSINQLQVISSLANVDFDSFIKGDITHIYSETHIKNMLRKMGYVINERALTNLLTAMNETKVIRYSAPDIIKMYHLNISSDNLIKDKKSMVEYLSEKNESLKEAIKDASFPLDAQMDITIESDSIYEELKRLEAFEKVFNS